MKTSNKLLAGAVGLIILSGLFGMISLRNSLVPRGIGHGANLIMGEGEIAKKEFKVATFSKFRATEGIEFTLAEGPEMVEVETQSNLLEYFEPSVEDNTLSINIKEGYSLHPSTTLKIKVGYNTLHKISSINSASVIGADTLKGASISLNAAAGGNITLMTKVQNLDVNSGSGGNINLSGSSDFINANSNSGANIHATDLISQRGDVRTNSGARIKVHVTEFLKANASSGGSIEYRGQPRLEQSSNSGGQIYGK